MNLLRKSSFILAGTAMAGLLAFACAENNSSDAASSSEMITGGDDPSSVVIAKVYAGGGAKVNGAAVEGSLDGDYVQLYNPTGADITFDKNHPTVLQFADAQNHYVKDYAVNLTGQTVKSGKYFLVSLTKGAKLGGAKIDLDANAVATAAAGTPVPALDNAGGSVALVGGEDQLECDVAADCHSSKVLSVFGYGLVDCAAPLAEGKAFGALTATQAAARKNNGCAIKGAKSSNADDFELASAAPIALDGFDCSTLGNDASAPPAPDASAPETDASAAAAAAAAPARPSAKCTPAGGKDASTDAAPTDKKDAAADDGSGDGSGDDGTPAPSTGKKKQTNLVTTPQPIAASSNSGCSAAPGAGSSSVLTGLAGLGLALASLGRRRKK